MVLLNTDFAAARLVIDRIFKNWLGDRPDGSPMTASIGVAERMVDEADDWPQIVKIADERMYAAKKRGKARCIGCYDEEIVGRRHRPNTSAEEQRPDERHEVPVARARTAAK